MLDDFRSVLQRLGAMKFDGTAVMLGDKRSVVGNGIETNSLRQERTPSLSGRVLDDDEILDDYGHGTRKQSMAAQAVGKIGVKIHKLPRLTGKDLKQKKCYETWEHVN